MAERNQDNRTSSRNQGEGKRLFPIAKAGTAEDKARAAIKRALERAGPIGKSHKSLGHSAPSTH
jgi:hypothetical protein